MMSSSAYADELVTRVEEGDPAPFNGTLFNDEAATELKVKLQFSQERCQLQIDEAVERKGIEMQVDVEVAQISHTSCEDRLTAISTTKNNHIDDLSRIIMDSDPPKRVVAPFVAGTVTGAAVVLLSAYAYSQVEKHSR